MNKNVDINLFSYLDMLTRIVSRVVRRAAGTEFVLARRVGDELVEVKFSEDDAEKLKQLAYNSGLTADGISTSRL